MKKSTVLLILFTVNMCVLAQDLSDNKLVAKGAKVELVADGFRFTEGPTADKAGNVYFTDQPNDRIMKWSVSDNKVSVFLENTGRANGLYFDKKGNILSCSDMDNEIWKIDMNGKHEVLVSNFEGLKMNGPNDLWEHPKGGIYFTDPLYKRNYWTRDPAKQMDGEHVYYLAPNTDKPIKLTNDLEQPNGIIGSPDGKRLFVADIKAGKTYVYDIQTDRTLANKKLFCNMGSDGMTMDNQGNIYLTGRGVTVFNPKGEQILQIPIKAGWTANVCFGGKNRDILFITASEYLYSLKMNVKGAK